MSRKDYVAIANAFADELCNAPANMWPGLLRAVTIVADVLAADNPRFNRGRFVDACLLSTGLTRW